MWIISSQFHISVNIRIEEQSEGSRLMKETVCVKASCVNHGFVEPCDELCSFHISEWVSGLVMRRGLDRGVLTEGAGAIM